MAVLGLRFCARAFSSCGKWGPLFITVRGTLTITASLVAEHRLQTRRLSNCGSRAYLLRGMWDPPRPGLEPASPALAGRLSTTAPPGKPLYHFYTRCRGCGCFPFARWGPGGWWASSSTSLMKGQSIGVRLPHMSNGTFYVVFVSLCHMLCVLSIFLNHDLWLFHLTFSKTKIKPKNNNHC